jgi:hypothetical protein
VKAPKAGELTLSFSCSFVTAAPFVAQNYPHFSAVLSITV